MALQLCKAFNFQLTLKFMAVTYVHLSMELFSNDQYCLLSSVACAAVVYCRYGVKKNQESINQCCHHTCNVCFYLGVMSQARIFSQMETSPLLEKDRIQILTYTRHSLLLNSEGSQACHPDYDTGHLCMMVISEDP